MAALLNLTRKLELLVARAAGISVWQFLAPPLVIAGVIGILSVAVYNPVSAYMKHRADGIEIKLFGQPGGPDQNQGFWIRQRSIDGQSIIRAERGAEGGTLLTGVSVYVYDQNGQFEESIEAARAKLVPGAWQLESVTILTPGEPPQSAGLYLLASNLDPEEISQNLVSPNSVPFWELPGLRERTESAGLDSTGYRLQFQMLLARPLLFVAMILIAAAFSLRFFRFGGIAKMVSGGVAAGFVLYVATKIVGDLGGSGLLSAPMAAWSPAIVASMLGTLALLNQEDG
jgi:lipopolysaccharide export system permease protein